MIIRGFVWFCLLAGVALVAFGLYYAFLGAGARSWPSVEGTITSVTVRAETVSALGDGTTERAREARRLYYPSVRYSYTVDGQSYSSAQARLGQGDALETFQQREDAVAAATKYRNGDSISVYYDPNDPSRAVLDRSLSWGVFVPLLAGLFLLGSGALFYVMMPALLAGARHAAGR